jgi:uncharacterized RDD family membrane protein YckC
LICRNHLDVAEGVRRCARCGAGFCGDCLVDIQGRPYCATCKNEQMLDFRSGVDQTVLNYASIGQRFGAQLLDGFIIGIPMVVIMMVIIFSTIDFNNGGEPNPLINLIGLPFVFVFPLYEALMMQYRNGQTLGKKIMNIRVVNADGAPISAGQAWGRSGMRMVFGFLSCLGLIDYIVAFFNAEKTTIHDMVATTRVVQTY